MPISERQQYFVSKMISSVFLFLFFEGKKRVELTNFRLYRPVVLNFKIIKYVGAVDDTDIYENTNYTRKIFLNDGRFVLRFFLVEELIVQQADWQADDQEIEEVPVSSYDNVKLQKDL